MQCFSARCSREKFPFAISSNLVLKFKSSESSTPEVIRNVVGVVSQVEYLALASSSSVFEENVWIRYLHAHLSDNIVSKIG